MYVKTFWQWLKPMLLILPVIVVTATTLLDLTSLAGSGVSSYRSSFSVNQLRTSPDDVIDHEQLAGTPFAAAALETPLAVKPAVGRSTMALGTHLRERMVRVVQTWVALMGDSHVRASSSQNLGDSFQDGQNLQAVVVHNPAPVQPGQAPAVTTAAPASNSDAAGSGSSNSGPGNGGDDDDGDDDDDDDDDDECDSSGPGNPCDD